jgi:hypothetical protein
MMGNLVLDMTGTIKAFFTFVYVVSGFVFGPSGKDGGQDCVQWLLGWMGWAHERKGMIDACWVFNEGMHELFLFFRVACSSGSDSLPRGARMVVMDVM